jgi:hypothetical protein
VLRVLTLLLIGVVGLSSFVYGFGVLMSHGWDSVEGRRASAERWQLLPPLGAGVGVLEHGIEGSLTYYRYEANGQTLLAPRWALAPQSDPIADVHYLSFAPQVAVPDPHFPWASLFALPLLCLLLALLVTRSGQISAALRETAEARARIAARKPVMR